MVASKSEELSAGLEDVLIRYITLVLDTQDEVEQVRLKAAAVAAELASLVKNNDRTRAIFTEQLGRRRASERSLGVQQALDRALKIVG